MDIERCAVNKLNKLPFKIVSANLVFQAMVLTKIIKVKIYLLKALLNFKFDLSQIRNRSLIRMEEGVE